jgi:hypothetical protein
VKVNTVFAMKTRESINPVHSKIDVARKEVELVRT